MTDKKTTLTALKSTKHPRVPLSSEVGGSAAPVGALHDPTPVQLAAEVIERFVEEAPGPMLLFSIGSNDDDTKRMACVTFEDAVGLHSDADEIYTVVRQILHPGWMGTRTWVMDWQTGRRAFFNNARTTGIAVDLPLPLDVMSTAREAVLFITGHAEETASFVNAVRPLFSELHVIRCPRVTDGRKAMFWVQVYPEDIAECAAHFDDPAMQSALAHVEAINAKSRASAGNGGQE